MTAFGWLVALIVAAVLASIVRLVHRRNIAGWLLSYLRQDWRAPAPAGTTKHVIFCFVDHYEPAWQKADLATQRERVKRWSDGYPQLCKGHEDSDGRPPIHTFFYPEEEYEKEHLDAIATLCRDGYGEIEVHLHHDDDNEANLRKTLREFTRKLVECHDALPVDPATGRPLWAFIHGNWALDNSYPDGTRCGINNELIILREEGCYADFTFPAAPDPCQTSTINQIYYATDDPNKPKSHDRGTRVRVGGKPVGDLMLIQGPLGFRWNSRKLGILPRIENSDVRASCPADAARIDEWVNTGIHVEGRPEWIFVKIHTHGTQDSDAHTLLGEPMSAAFHHLETRYKRGEEWKLHYVSAREMYNIAKAAEAGRDGDPNAYRDFVIPRPQYRPPASS
jgi:hypothetical protein